MVAYKLKQRVLKIKCPELQTQDSQVGFVVIYILLITWHYHKAVFFQVGH